MASGDYVSARDRLNEASAREALIATWYLGDIYRTGKGVARPMSAGRSRYYRQVALA